MHLTKETLGIFENSRSAEQDERIDDRTRLCTRAGNFCLRSITYLLLTGLASHRENAYRPETLETWERDHAAEIHEPSRLSCTCRFARPSCRLDSYSCENQRNQIGEGDREIDLMVVSVQ